MHELAVILIWLAPLLLVATVLLARHTARQWVKRLRRDDMETDAQWWDQFQKRVRGS